MENAKSAIDNRRPGNSIRRVRKFLLLLSVLGLLVSPVTRAQQSRPLTEEQKKRAFLKAREEIKTMPASPAPQATPRPKPKPVRPPTTPEPTTPRPATPRPATPRPTTPKPEPEMPPKPRPKPEPEPEATPRPRPAVTPAPATPKPATPSPKPPTPKPPVERPQPTPRAPILIEKKTEQELEPVVDAPKNSWWGFRRYKYLTGTNQKEIDKAPVKKSRWRYLVVHNSGTRQGNAKAFDYYHRYVRKMPNGMAYQFVIGNGSSSGDGQIEIGNRWRRQVNGGHVHSDYLNNIALGICLVGDFNRDKPTKRQLEALDELITYLRKRVGKTEGKVAVVRAHRQINPPRWPTDCPGNRFPFSWLDRQFD